MFCLNLLHLRIYKKCLEFLAYIQTFFKCFLKFTNVKEQTNIELENFTTVRVKSFKESSHYLLFINMFEQL